MPVWPVCAWGLLMGNRSVIVLILSNCYLWAARQGQMYMGIEFCLCDLRLWTYDLDLGILIFGGDGSTRYRALTDFV